LEQEFQQFYDTKLLPSLQAIEQERLALKQKKIKALAVLIALGAIITLATQNIGFIFFPIVIGVLWYFFVFQKQDAKIAITYKEEIIKKSVAHFFKDISYDPYSGLDEGKFIAIDLFEETPDRYNAEDLFSGAKEKTKFNFSEVHAEYKTERTSTDSKGNTTTRTEWHTIFKGIIFCADFNKQFFGTTFIQKNTFKLWDSKSRVELEDPNFEAAFDVYSNNQQEARYLITPAFMERFIDINKHFGGDISATFYETELIMAIPFDANNFEVSTWSTVLKPEKLKYELTLINNIIKIIDTLDLNTRIWSKE
jgi:Protein of unknown function (DUF3137)